MTVTVTFNPAIDYVLKLDEMKPGLVNRALGEQIFFGGKGINVSAVLKELGVSSKALGFTAGFTGEAIENGVRAMGIESDFVRLESGNSRINVKIKASEETEINGQGPDIDSGALKKLFEKLDALKEGDTLILAGSIPASLPADIYERILERLSGKNIKAVVDATGSLLVNVLKFRPFLIKPNDHELEEIFKTNISGNDEIELYAKKLQQMGAKNVLVSMAEKGALLVDENGVTHSCGVCKGVVKNSVGAGDSMVAGFVAGSSNGDYEYALKLATACGGATAFSEGLADRALIDELFSQL